MMTVALLGTGAMGSRVGMNLLARGFPLVVWNRSPDRCRHLVEKGARQGDSPRQAAEQAEVVISMVRDDEASRAIWIGEPDGAIHGMQAGAIAIESSTLSLDWIETLERQLQARSLAFLAAPVLGSRPQAQSGQLVYLAGGEQVALASVRTVLDASAAAIHHVGSATEAMRLKLAINGFLASQVASLAELLGLLQAGGQDRQAILSLFAQLPVTSKVMQAACHAMAEDSHAPQFPVELVHKDLSCLQALARSLGIALPQHDAVRQTYERAMAAGHGELNITGVSRLSACR